MLADIAVFRHYLRPYARLLAFILFLLLADSLTALLGPWIAGYFTQLLVSEQPPGIFNRTLTLNQVLVLWLLVLLVQFCLRFAHQYLSGKVSTRVVADLNVELYTHIQQLPLTYFNERKKGQILSLLTNDIHILSGYLSQTIISIVPQMLTFLLALVLMFMISPFIALLACVSVPLFFLVMKIIGRKIRPLSQAMAENYDEMIAIADENLHLIHVLKAFNREPLEAEKYRRANADLIRNSDRYLYIQSLLTPAIHFLGAAAIIILLWLASVDLEQGQLTAADLVRLVLYGMLLVAPVSHVAGVYGQTQHARAAAARLRAVFMLAGEVLENTAGKCGKIRGLIEFHNVDFSYPGREPVLQEFNLIVKAGEKVAITGKNGAGKTTLVYLLQRFMEPDAGSILVDGTDIREYSLPYLRRRIGVVQQNVLLLNGTIRENISYGRPDASDDEIMNAASKACALDFIRALPQAMQTIIGDQGIKLSGGQKQRLSLARSLLNDPPILVLDEATAMFDPEGEASFVAECMHSLQEHTVLIITHRPKSLALADRILVLEDGKIRNQD